MFLVVKISKKQGKYEVLIGWVGVSLRQKTLHYQQSNYRDIKWYYYDNDKNKFPCLHHNLS